MAGCCWPPKRLEAGFVALSAGGGPAGVVELAKLNEADFAGVAELPPRPNRFPAAGFAAPPPKRPADGASVVGVACPLLF